MLTTISCIRHHLPTFSRTRPYLNDSFTHPNHFEYLSRIRPHVDDLLTHPTLFWSLFHASDFIWATRCWRPRHASDVMLATLSCPRHDLSTLSRPPMFDARCSKFDPRCSKFESFLIVRIFWLFVYRPSVPFNRNVGWHQLMEPSQNARLEKRITSRCFMHGHF